MIIFFQVVPAGILNGNLFVCVVLFSAIVCNVGIDVISTFCVVCCINIATELCILFIAFFSSETLVVIILSSFFVLWSNTYSINSIASVVFTGSSSLTLGNAFSTSFVFTVLGSYTKGEVIASEPL